MQNNAHHNDNTPVYDYRGKRGVVLLRVSTEEQEKKYGFPSQLRSIRENLLIPRGIRVLDEEKHIIRDTYTGMEFREREELAKILEMAKRHEFDVLLMDVLDRLGRKGLQREIYRAELRMYGVRILTTKPEEHADDDSLMGEMIRMLHGFKAEEERNDMIRRTQNGKRERVLKDHKLLGTHVPKFGWKFVDGDRGVYVLNDGPLSIGEVQLRDEDGDPWTEVKVWHRMFYLADHGCTIRSISSYLTDQHIPTRRGAKWEAPLVQRFLTNKDNYLASDKPILAYGFLPVLDEEGNVYTEQSITRMICDLDEKDIKAAKIAIHLIKKGVPTGQEAYWNHTSVLRMLRDEYAIGRAAIYKTRAIKDGRGKRNQIKREVDEWIYLPEGTVPPILVTEEGKPDIELFGRVQKRLEINQQISSRNNKEHTKYLLHGGLAKCGYCGGSLVTGALGGKYPGYRCRSGMYKPSKCPARTGATIEAHIIETEVWAVITELIRDPSEVDRRVEAKRIADPNIERRQHITNEIAKIKARQNRLRDRLEDEDLDNDTYTDIKRRLKELANQKQAYENELNVEINIHEEWKQEQEKLKNFHNRCREMREQLNDPAFEPGYVFKREAVKFFGIMVVVWKTDHKPRFEIQCNPPSILTPAR